LHRRLALLTTLALATPALVTVSQAGAPSYRVHAVTITTRVPSAGTLGGTTCVVDADLYTPARVDRRHPAPAILTTNGFGGSKAGLASTAKGFAASGYVVLAYSGLGFGADPQASQRGSDCKITFDDRQHDGAAASQLVDFLGGLRRADDGTRVDYVRKDRVAHDGRVHRGDVRVGMIGGSYGGQAAFAAAAADPRVDAIVPLITWNDLAYSLSPNNTTLAPGTVTYRVPGTEKVQWHGFFLELGLKAGALGAASVSTRVGPCPNFSDAFCQALSTIGALGYADASAQAVARNASVTSYLSKIRVPVLLGQGETDTLFPLREAIATYNGLRARRVPVKMVWQHWGHGARVRPGEYGGGWGGTAYEDRLISEWFAFWLKGEGPRPTLDFHYYRPWLDKGDARAAFATAPSFPLPGTTTLYASGAALHPTAAALSPGSATMAAPGSAPLSSSEASPLLDTTFLPDVPAATAVLSTRPLRHDVDVVGAPTAQLRLWSPTAGPARPESMLVAFVKLYDVAPDGTIDASTRLVAPLRISDLSRPVSVALPAMVHRFKAGHRMQLVVSLTDFAYKGNAQAQVAMLTTSATAPTTLTLPGRIDLSAFPTG
jgi:ABC-2 type transport system ATP-binding protein